MHWLTIDWWYYLLTGKGWDYRNSPWSGEARFSIKAFFCRMQGHPAGTVYYTSFGFEPDHTCKNCGDNLG